jgi:hypothetical protein
LAIAVAGFVMVAVAAGAYLHLRDDVPALADPGKVPLPRVRDAAATQVYLKGPGADLLLLHRAARPLTTEQGTRDLAACRRVIRRRLHPAGSPRSLARLAARVPDRVARDAFASELRAVADVLAACRTGDGRPAAVEDLTFHMTVLDRRLKALKLR